MVQWLRLCASNMGFPGSSSGKEFTCNAGDPDRGLSAELRSLMPCGAAKNKTKQKTKSKKIPLKKKNCFEEWVLLIIFPAQPE